MSKKISKTLKKALSSEKKFFELYSNNDFDNIIKNIILEDDDLRVNDLMGCSEIDNIIAVAFEYYSGNRSVIQDVIDENLEDVVMRKYVLCFGKLTQDERDQLEAKDMLSKLVLPEDDTEDIFKI